MISPPRSVRCFFFFNDTATTEIYTLSLHDALPIYLHQSGDFMRCSSSIYRQESYFSWYRRSEEHTSELQSPCNLVCRLLLEKKKETINRTYLVYQSATTIIRLNRRQFTLAMLCSAV